MKTIDFTQPQRMSKSAYVVLFVQCLQSFMSNFFIIFVFGIFNFLDDLNAEFVWRVLLLLAGCLLLAASFAFASYYFKKYYVEDGNLIFQHGFVKREVTSIPLNKIHSLRTKRGLIYRLLDMRGITFDTLASQEKEIELILDELDWEALLHQIELQEGSATEAATSIDATEEDSMGHTENATFDIQFSNWNLIKGAFCQNHLRGMVTLGLIVGWVFNQVNSYKSEWITQGFDSLAEIEEAGTFDVWSLWPYLLFIYLLVLLLWIGKVFLRYYHMILQVSHDQLFFESGLLSRNSSRFALDKICSINVKCNPIEKLLSASTIQVKQARNATDEKRGDDVIIYGSNSSHHFLTWWLGPDYLSSPVLATAHSGYGVMGFVLRKSLPLLLIVSVILVHFELYYGLFFIAAYVVYLLVYGYLASRRSHIVLKDDYIEVHGGAFASTCNYVKYANVEIVLMGGSPLTPYSHRVRIAISTKGTDYNIYSLKAGEARLVYELILQKVSAEQVVDKDAANSKG